MGSRVTMRLKTIPAILQKMDLMDWDSVEDVYDILGFRVTQATTKVNLNTLDKLVSILEVTRVKCYGVCSCRENMPYECEDFTPYRSDGYRRIHILVTVPKYHRQVEIQLCTP